MPSKKWRGIVFPLITINWRIPCFVLRRPRLEIDHCYECGGRSLRFYGPFKRWSPRRGRPIRIVDSVLLQMIESSPLMLAGYMGLGTVFPASGRIQWTEDDTWVPHVLQ